MINRLYFIDRGDGRLAMTYEEEDRPIEENLDGNY
jgi:hypothetical protein